MTPALPQPAIDTCQGSGQEPALQALLRELEETARSHFEAGYQAYVEENWAEADEQFALSLSVFDDRRDLMRECPTLAAAYEDVLERLLPLRETLARNLDAIEESEGAKWIEGAEPAAVDDLAGLEDTTLSPEEARRGQEAVEKASQGQSFDLPVVLNSSVLYFIERFKGRDRNFFESSLRRSGAWLEMIHRIFSETGVPEDLAALALVESGFKTKALSRARAYGMWQFIRGTAVLYGLRIDTWQDERADPEKATRAAAQHLKDLYTLFGDWNLAMAAYNAGKGRIEKAIQRGGTSDFWELASTRHLPQETKNYVPAVLAATIILKDPGSHGFAVPPDPPLTWDKVALDSQTSLDLVARCAGTDLETLRQLNPELKYNTTPPHHSPYEIRIPAGRRQAFLAELATVPARERVLTQMHVVHRGDTLSALARRYQTSIEAICQANALRSRSTLHIGQELVIPGWPATGSGKTERSTHSAGRASAPAPSGGETRYTVRRGDNLWRIARRFGTSAKDLASWNGISTYSTLQPGQRLTIRPGAAGRPPSDPGKRVSGHADTKQTTYRVRRGDTLSSIARKFHTSVQSLRRWNRLPSHRIISGDLLTIYLD